MIDHRVIGLFQREGLEQILLDSATSDTSLTHDFALIGDTLEEVLEEFASLYDIDMTNFKFDEFSPGEVGFDTLMFDHKFLRKWPYFRTRFARYRPLKIAYLENALKHGKWID